MVVVLLCLAQFVVVDATIVAIALPAIQDDLGLSIAALQWVVTAYTLAFGGTLLAAGRLADRFGRRRAFVAGLFALASLACGWRPAPGLLLAARAAQGLGAAVVAPAALALLTTACSNERARARALGWWTAAAAGGGASGWVLGGVLTGLLSWRWVFLINLPVCAAAVVLAPRVLPNSASGPRRAPTSQGPSSPRRASQRSSSPSRSRRRAVRRRPRRPGRWRRHSRCSRPSPGSRPGPPIRCSAARSCAGRAWPSPTWSRPCSRPRRRRRCSCARSTRSASSDWTPSPPGSCSHRSTSP